MLALLLVALVSVLVPLSLCVVPSLARFTIFPLLSALIHRFTSAYVLPTLQIEYFFGSFDVRNRANDIRETLRGVTVSLLQLQLQPAVLASLALEKKGTGPMTVQEVTIREVSLRLGSPWRVVIDVHAVDVHVAVLEANAETLLDLQDAVALKVGEAAGWISRFAGQKTKDDAAKQVAAMAPSDRQFGLKDRILQLVVAQIQIYVRDVNVVIDAPSRQPERVAATRVRATIHELAVWSAIVHENVDQARELLLTSTAIRESHEIRIDALCVTTATATATEPWKGQRSPEQSIENKESKQATTLVDVPALELHVDVPPLARLLGLVPSYAPIPLDKRVGTVQVLLPATNRVTLDKDALVRVLQDAFVPYADYQVALKIARDVEAEHAARDAATADEKAFYVDAFTQIETQTKLAAEHKAKLQERLAAIEAKLVLNELVTLRMKSLGLDTYFCGPDCTGLGLDECMALANELAAKPENVPFSKMQIALRLETLSIDFQDEQRQLAEFSVHDVGLNVQQFTIAQAETKLLQDMELTLEQVIFAVLPPVISTVGPHESPSSKILYADYTHLTVALDAATVRPQQLTATIKQYERGKQQVTAALRGVQIVAAAHELECFLLYVDRLGTDVGQAMAAAKPMPTLPPIEKVSTGATPASTPVAQTSDDLAPFAVLGGMLLELDVLLDGCRLLVLPAESFADAVLTDVDYDGVMEHTGRHGMGQSRVELPICLRVTVSSSTHKELVQVDLAKFAIIARYLDGVTTDEDDTDHLLAPTALSLTHELVADPANARVHRQKVSVTVPDMVMSFSDLSLALVSSCSKALSKMQTTTPERAQLRLETKLKLDEQQKQAELDAILERIRRMFDEIDQDKNGHIELGELLMLLRRAKVADALLERELEYFVRILFKEIDRDGNGFIEFDELRVYLRDDLMHDGTALIEANGSGELDGSLNLRGGEYRSTEELEKLSGGVKPTSRAQMEEIMSKPFFKGRFFDLYEAESHATKATLHGQRAIDVQKKLVRLLGNYDAAELSWNLLIEPELPAEEKAGWLLQVSTRCGGISEYQNAAKVIARQKKDTIFATALQQAEDKLLTVQARPVVKKQLVLSTDIKLGNLQLVLTDPELPVQHSRGFFAIQNVKLSVDVQAGEIAVNGPVDWAAIATSTSAEWTALFGVRVVAMSYSDLANAMEDIIEPWELVAGLSSSLGENGVAVLVEAQTRFQFNVTPGLLKMYRALNEVLAADSALTAWKKHQEAFRTGLVTRSSQEGADCVVQNLTGSDVVVVVGGERLQVEAEQRVTTKLTLAADGSATMDALELVAWGVSKDPVVLPSFGTKNVLIQSHPSAQGAALFVTAYCRLEDPLRQRIVLKSNLYVCNHSSQDYELKYLTLGNAQRAAVMSKVVRLCPNERTTLPLSVLMGMTEVYARPVRFTDWIIHATLNDELVTSPAAVHDVDEQDTAMQAKLVQRRGGAIVNGVTQENSSKLVKQLAPGVLLRRWHLRTHVEWEMSLLPAFVVRNSLPYKLEYRFVEYKVKSTKNVAAEFARVEAALKADDDKVPPEVISGSVSSGHDAEVTGVTCLYPGYLAVRVVSKQRDQAGVQRKSQWSKPVLMAIHGATDHFTIARENVDVDTGVRVSIDRLSLPNLPRLVRFSCPYWIVNNTSLDLAIASAAPGAKLTNLEPMASSTSFGYPRMTYLEHDRLSIKPLAMTGTRPSAWNALGKVPASAYSKNPLTDEALKAASWSEPMNSTTVNTIGEISSGPSVFGVKIEGLYGAFEQSVALTLTPRFYVQNRLKETVFVQTFATSEAVDSADQLFRTKRTADEAKAAQTSVRTGESTPMYHFFALKKGETLTQTQKFIALSFGDAWGDGSWSHVIPVSTAGDSYIQLYSPLRQRFVICLVSVQVIDLYVYVILSDSSGAPPYRIENFTPFQLTCSQISEESSLFKSAAIEASRTIKHGDWHAFAWSNSLAKQHKLQIRLQLVDGRKKDATYDMDAVGYHESIVLEQAKGSDGNTCERVEILVQTVVDEGTRVLKFVEKELEMHRLENQEAQFAHEFEQRKMLFASSFDIRLAGFGLSLFDALPQEVLFVSVDVIQVQKLPASLTWDCSIFHSQIDNMLPSAKFPVILNPLNSGFSDKTPGQPPKPLVNFVLDADLAAKVGIYKLLELQLHSLGLYLDLDYIVNLVKLVEPYLASDAAMLHASLQTLERVLQRQVPPVPAAELTADGNIRHNVLYFDLLRIGALSIDLEYSITRKDIVANAGGSNSVVFGLLTQVIGLIGSNLSGSPTLSFSEIVIQRCFSTKARLQSQLLQNFVRQAVMQAYRLIGSADIIGDPIGLVEDLGSGVVEFFKITKGELLGDAQTRGEGVKVLGKTVAQTGASTLAKITGSLDRFVGDFSQDDESSETAAASEQPQDASSSGLKFAKDLGKGFTGIFTKPVEGARKGGLGGLLSGTVQGIAGPGVVLLKQITSTTHTIALGVQSTVVDRSPFGGRRRLPKKVDGNRVVADFDEQHYRPTRLLLEVVSAQGLLSDESCDPTCVVRIDDKPVLKTNVLYNTLNPVWREKTQVELTGKEQEVQFVVKDSYGGTVEKTVGKCIVAMEDLQDDFRPPQFSSSLAQWVKTGIKPEETKKNVSNVVKEKEYTLYARNEASSGAAKAVGSATALLGLGNSSKVKLSEKDVHVLVTIAALRDLRITSSSGGGVLGLGNLVSSTPNISPFVSVHVGNATQKTHTAKIQFQGTGADQKGSAEWNETFTFPVVKQPAENAAPAVLLSLKDKSMLHDETLGYASLPLLLTPTKKPIEQEIEVRSAKTGGELVAWLQLKVEVIGATASALVLESATSPSPKTAAQDGSFMLGPDAIKAGKIRVACEFV